MPMGPAGIGREIGREGIKLHHKAAGCDDDKAAHGGFGRPEDAQHGPVQGLRNPPHHSLALKPQHGEKGSDYPFERFTVAFDGQGPVQSCFLIRHKEHNRNI